jgi:hypothetical protein
MRYWNIILRRTELILLLVTLRSILSSQNSTFSPYSRYGIGELAPVSLAHNQAMGGAFVALKPDSTMPVFINTGNPASYALIRLTSLEVGGRYSYEMQKASNGNIPKWGTNFSYATLGFPVGRRGGGVIGIAPYSYSGYESQHSSDVTGIGSVTNRYDGNGGFNKAWVGYGIMPFMHSRIHYLRRVAREKDSTWTRRKIAGPLRYFGSKVLSDLSMGFNAFYLFGAVSNSQRVIFPNSLLFNNLYTDMNITGGDFSGNFGLQTAITIDSVRKKDGGRRALREKVKFVFGYFASLSNLIRMNASQTAFSYVLTGTGEELIRDTLIYSIDRRVSYRLPLEQGFGIGFKKGEKLSIAADFGITAWSRFAISGLNVGELKDEYRVSAGMSYVQDKYASGRGSFGKRVQYRCGFTFRSGFIVINKQLVDDRFASVGVGLPVGIGRLSSMVHISLQAGQLAAGSQNLLKENYFRVYFGFTFSDRWFQKFRYD